jgi:hypothetical protein
VTLQKLSIFILSTFILSACGDDEDSSANLDDSSDAQYQVKFESEWNNINFPTQFPSNAHFSGLVGATHNGSINFWIPGQLASDGIKQVAETGGKSQLLLEVNSGVETGDVDLVLNGSGIGSSSDTVSYEFSINQSHSLVTIVSMVAPSPDWIVGVHDLDLFDNEQNDWKSLVRIELPIYDAGTDSGSTFKSGNTETDPREIITLLSSEVEDTDFIDGVQSGTMQAIGSFTFTRIQ